MPDYAWIITTDHLDDGEAGTSGPRNAPSDLLHDLDDGKGLTFRMHDGDDILYYTGRIVTRQPDDYGHEDVAYAPLRDFGMPNAGCVTITYPGRPDLDCG